MPSIHDQDGLPGHFREARVDPQRLRRLRNAFYKRAEDADAALGQLSELDRRRLQIEFHALELAERHDSAIDGATKLLFRTRLGFRIETVILRIGSGRTALCLSSQVGCAANCAFCATGKMGVAQDLTASEILDQLIQANSLLRDEGRRVRNVVFMGMGEPFHNEQALHESLDVLHSTECFNLSPRQVVVSTVGIPDAMLRFARAFPGTHLALSLHSARQEVRETIVPLARRHDLDSLREALVGVTRIQGRSVMIEYLLLEGVNDTREDLLALTRFLEGLAVHVNLIPYNPIEQAPELSGTDRLAREAFGAALKQAGFRVTLRYSLGADIAAACGQLVRRENRRIARELHGASPPSGVRNGL